MAKKRSSAGSKKPLEWVFDYENTTDDTVGTERIELGLKDDEVAEIHKIDSMIKGGLTAGADDVVSFDMMLSMDPNIASDPSAAGNHEDLEVFFENNLEMDRDLTTSGQSQGITNKHKISDFDPPILVGTDVGMVVKGDATVAGEFWTRLYFTRRKATVMELNQILLKRR